MLSICEIPVIFCAEQEGWHGNGFFFHIFFWEKLKRLQLLKIAAVQLYNAVAAAPVAWCCGHASPLIFFLINLTKRQWLSFHMPVFSFVVPEHWRRPGSSYRKKYCRFRASSWKRRRSASSMKRWSDGCRNVYCCSPRWGAGECLVKYMSLFPSGEGLDNVWKNTCPYFFPPDAALDVSYLYPSATCIAKLLWGLCIADAVTEMWHLSPALQWN